MACKECDFREGLLPAFPLPFQMNRERREPKMGNLEWATWALVLVSAVLAFATLLYAYYTKKMLLGSEKQLSAFGELTKSINDLREIKDPLVKLGLAVKSLPSGFHMQEVAEKIAEERQRAMGAGQRKATGRE